MSLGSLSVRRAVTTSMAYLCLAGFGAFSLYNLPVNRLPEVELPVIAVVTTYTGASPEDMEALVTEPIERAVSSVGGIESVESTSRQSTSVVIISFTWGTDMETAEVEVRKNLELFAGDFLPDDAARPLTFAFDPSLAPVVFLTVEGDMDRHRLRRIAVDRIQPGLGRVDGVAAAEILGGLDRQIRVQMKPDWLEAYRITPSEVVDALRVSNTIAPSGAVDTGIQRLNLQPTGLYRNVDEIRDVVVAVRGGRQVLLREIAAVQDAFQEEEHVVAVGGVPAVVVAVRKQSDANTVEVGRNVARAVPRLNASLPEGVALKPLFDTSKSVLRAVANLAMTGGQAFALTGLVLLVFLRSWRSSLIAMVAVPTSILVSFTAMSLLGVTLNLISMAGLALAIGMIVDNGIVVLEAAYQHLDTGKSRREAALLGARDMSMPLTASTLTTVVVFLPILLVEGIAGELFRDLVLTISVTLLSSLLVAVSLVPLMVSRMGKPTGRSRIGRWLGDRTAWIDQIVPAYGRALAWALERRKRVVAGAFLASVVSVAAVPLLGQDFLPKADTSEVLMEVTGPPGASIDTMRRLIRQVERSIALTVPEADVVSSDFGTPEGFGAIFGATANKGTVRIGLPPPAARGRTQQEIEAKLTAAFADLPGVAVELRGTGIGGQNGDVAIKLFGDDLRVLRQFGRRVQSALDDIEGVRETRFSMAQGAPELAVEYDRERLRSLGLTPARVDDTISSYFQGVTATVFRDEGEEVLVRVRAPKRLRSTLDQLAYLPVSLPAVAEATLSPGAGPGSVPLGSLAELKLRLGPVDIDHESQQRLATVSVMASGFDLGGLTREVEETVAALGVPEGIRVETGGTAEDLRDAFFKLGLALIAALLLVYMVLASQFESLLEPFVIMFTVPLGVTGVVAGLFLTGTTLQVTALVGVILLGGVVVNNGIVLVDLLKRRVSEGRSLMEAALDAGRSRIRPILMTSLTTILGMLPLSFGYGDGAETWAPMARAVVGGMVVSTALTLFVIPCLYLIVAGRWAPPAGTSAAAPPEGFDVATDAQGRPSRPPERHVA